MSLPDLPWGTSFPAKQDTVGSEQPDLRNESHPKAGDGNNFLVEHVHALRDKAQAIALKVGDDSNLPVGSLLARVAALELVTKPGWDRNYLARAVAKTGIPESEIGFYFDEFDGGEDARWIPSEHGSVGHVDVLGGGIMKLHAAAGSDCNLGLYGYPVGRLLVDMDQPWYAALRFLIPSNPIPSDGEASMSLRLVDTDGGEGIPNGVGAGYVPLFASSTKFMAATLNGSSMEVKLSTVSVDNSSFHILEIWYDGATRAFAYDDETPIQFAGTYPPSGMTGVIIGGNAGPSLDLDVVVDKLIVAFPLPVYSPPT